MVNALMRLYRNSYRRHRRRATVAAAPAASVTCIWMAKKMKTTTPTTMIKIPEKIWLVISDAIQITSIQLVYRAHRLTHQCHAEETVCLKNATTIPQPPSPPPPALPQEGAHLHQMKTSKTNRPLQKLPPPSLKLIVMAIIRTVAAMM